LTATILADHRCAASSLSFSIFSNALTSGFVLISAAGPAASPRTRESGH